MVKNYTLMDSEKQELNPLVHIILRAMDSKGIKQRQLSKLSGVGQSSLSRLLNGKVNTKVDNVYKVLKTLDIISDGKQRKTSKDDACNLYHDMLESLLLEGDEAAMSVIKGVLLDFYERRSVKKTLEEIKALLEERFGKNALSKEPTGHGKT